MWTRVAVGWTVVCVVWTLVDLAGRDCVTALGSEICEDRWSGTSLAAWLIGLAVLVVAGAVVLVLRALDRR